MAWALMSSSNQARHSITYTKLRRHSRAAILTIVTMICLTAFLHVWDTRPPNTPAEPQPLSLQSMSLLLPTWKTLHLPLASSSSMFVITLITSSRPGNISYLPGTLQSLDCALQPPRESWSSHNSNSSVPRVLAVNTQVPARQHVVFEAIKHQHEGLELQAGQGPRLLSFKDVGNLHSELHSQEFVQELAKRSQEGFKAPPEAGEAASDPASRFWWRSKEALDTAYVLEAGLQAAPGAEYVIFLEDDIMLAPGFVDKLASFIAERRGAGDTADVISLYSFGPAADEPVKDAMISGSTAVAFHASIVPGLVAHIRATFADGPVDWLMLAYNRDNNKSVWTINPNIVQHVGVTSSLAGKQQKWRSASFRDTGCFIPAGSAGE